MAVLREESYYNGFCGKRRLPGGAYEKKSLWCCPGLGRKGKSKRVWSGSMRIIEAGYLEQASSLVHDIRFRSTVHL